MLKSVNAEGWYQDPYGIHGARWFSDGAPTSLVRDGEVESKDPAPAGPIPGPILPLPDRPGNSDDVKRADAAESVDQSVTSGQMIRAVVDGSGKYGIGFN